MIQPITLSATHMECRNLEDSFAVMTELLAFKKMSKEPGEATLKHPNSPWILVLHEAGADAPAKPMHNHWGVRVLTTEEVDKAYEYLTAHKQQYKLGAIGKPTWRNRIGRTCIRRNAFRGEVTCPRHLPTALWSPPIWRPAKIFTRGF